MTHPNPDELIAYLYDELDPARRAAVGEHLHACEACRQCMASWGGVRQDLAAWELPQRHGSVGSARNPVAAWPMFRWGAAAAVLIATGYGLARWNAAPPPPAPLAVDASALRAEVARELGGVLREELRRELAAEQARFAAGETAEREDFQRAMVQALDALETRQLTEDATLRADIETVALRAQKELSQLAVSARPGTGIIPQAR